MSSSMDFMDSLEGELNRRLAVLAVLYIRRRAFPNTPEVTLSQIEGSMGFPRDYLEFTLWYLLKSSRSPGRDNSHRHDGKRPWTSWKSTVKHSDSKQVVDEAQGPLHAHQARWRTRQ